MIAPTVMMIMAHRFILMLEINEYAEPSHILIFPLILMQLTLLDTKADQFLIMGQGKHRIYSASQKKGNPQIKLIFLETAMICQKKFTLLQKSAYPLSFDTSYKMYWPCMAKHEPFEMVMSKLNCAE